MRYAFLTALLASLTACTRPSVRFAADMKPLYQDMVAIASDLKRADREICAQSTSVKEIQDRAWQEGQRLSASLDEIHARYTEILAKHGRDDPSFIPRYQDLSHQIMILQIKYLELEPRDDGAGDRPAPPKAPSTFRELATQVHTAIRADDVEGLQDLFLPAKIAREKGFLDEKDTRSYQAYLDTLPSLLHLLRADLRQRGVLQAEPKEIITREGQTRNWAGTTVLYSTGVGIDLGTYRYEIVDQAVIFDGRCYLLRLITEHHEAALREM